MGVRLPTLLEPDSTSPWVAELLKECTALCRTARHSAGQYRSADTAYVLAFSVIMLNTDAHNPGVKNKMTKEGFLKNNRGIDDGQDLDQEELGALYDRIVNNEIKLKDENAKKASNSESSSNLNNPFSTLLLL